jgi:ankyrin repeat protein
VFIWFRRFGALKKAIELMDLIGAIAKRDLAATEKILADCSGLACEALSVGASRGDPNTFFLPALQHYLYKGDTALHAASAAHFPEAIDLLVVSGAVIDSANRRGAQAIHYAVDGNPALSGWDDCAQKLCVKALISYGANQNCFDSSGVAPLHRAVRNRCAGAVLTLVENGADIHLKSKKGSTALHLAVQNTGRGGSGAESAKEAQLEIIDLLLKSGASLQDRDARGKTVYDCIQANWLRDYLQNR